MNKSKLIFFIFILLVSNYTFGQKFYSVPSTIIDISNISPNTTQLNVNGFNISEFITVANYKDYLSSIRRDSSNKFYQSQLPASNIITKKMVRGIVKSENLQNEPMPCVTWSSAKNYCKWLTSKAKENNLNYSYDIPFLSQVIAFDMLYQITDTNKLLTWTNNNYDESLMAFSSYVDYSYDALNSDSPVFKRKTVYGTSYHMKYVPYTTYKALEYEYQDSSSRFIGFRIVRKLLRDVEVLNAQNDMEYIDTTFIFEDRSIKVEIENNKFHGNYVEKYKNGNYKVIGEFYQGQRVGVWSIWDESQTLIIQRDYKHNKKCDFIYPISDYPYKDIYESYPPYEYERNKKQYYSYHFVEERAIGFSKRIHREISDTNEPQLFKLIDFKELTQTFLNKHVRCYLYGNYCDFKKQINYDSIQSEKEQILLSDFRRFEIKEDFYFNIDKLMGNSRPISISLYLNKEDMYPKYSFYFPEIRPLLAKTPIIYSSLCDITNLDDYFFFESYRGEIKNNNENLSDWETELKIITSEHNQWIGFGR